MGLLVDPIATPVVMVPEEPIETLPIAPTIMVPEEPIETLPIAPKLGHFYRDCPTSSCMTFIH
jgi:hypothetical protein